MKRFFGVLLIVVTSFLAAAVVDAFAGSRVILTGGAGETATYTGNKTISGTLTLGSTIFGPYGSFTSIGSTGITFGNPIYTLSSLTGGGLTVINADDSTPLPLQANLTTSPTITAAVSSVQTGSPLTKDFNVISTCGTAGDAVTLPVATAGRRLIILNLGANSADVFPASGDVINEGSADAAKALGVDAAMECWAYDATNWECRILAAR